MNRRSALASFAVLALAAAARAQWSFVEELRAVPTGVAGGNACGKSIDTDGATLAIGCPRLNQGVGGRVYVYTRSAGIWTQQAELVASDDISGNGFGWSVALSGNTIVAGANLRQVGTETGAGAAYVFTRTGSVWTQQQKLTASDVQQDAEFGTAVAVSGNTCAIGAPKATTQPSVFAGATYVFVRSGVTWTQQQRIVPSGNLYGARSGSALALQGDSLLIGAPTWFDQPNNTLFAGSAYEWVRVGASWSQAATLVPTDTINGRQFGASLGLDGQRAIVGAWADDTSTGLDVGTAYVFVRSGGGWTQEAELAPTGIDHADQFGTSVAISGTTAVVGAPNGASTVSAGSGTVRLFEFDGAVWNEELALLGSATSNGDRLGESVSIDGDFVAAGASNGDDPNTGTSGEAYVWHTDPPVAASYCTAKTNSLGCVPAIASSGTPSATLAAPFTLSASLVRNQKLGLCFYGFGPNATPFQGAYMCVQPPTQRLPTQLSNGSASPANDCSGAYSLDFNARIQSGIDPQLVPGADVYCQWWSRDPGAVANTGLTDALRARIQP